MPTVKEYTEIYDIESKTQAIVSEGKVIKVSKFLQCPYVWFGKLKAQIESGEIIWLAWNKRGLV